MRSSTARALPALFSCLFLFGCSSPQDRAYEAQERVHEERLKLIDEYKNCVEDADGDKAKTEACEQYLKAAESLN